MTLRSQPARHIFLLLGMCLFLFFFRIGGRDLWNPDEPRYAQVAREMLETGDWIVPHLNEDVYKEKPPLYFWLVVLVSKPFGDVSETTARLPSAVSATLVVLLTYILGLKILGAQEGLWGASLMATSTQFFWIGRTGTLDMLLMLCILAALMVFYVAYAHERPLFFMLGFVFLAPAVLTKGPVGIAIPLLVMLTFLLVDVFLRIEGAKKRLALFGGATLIGLIVVAALVLPWLYAAHQRSGGIYGSLAELSRQTGGRIVKSYSHQRPFYYYFAEMLWQALPWTLFFPLAVYTLKKKGEFRKDRGFRFLVVWFLSIFLFFTLISGKRSQYILPLFPAGGLLLGWALTAAHPSEGRLSERRGLWIPLLLIALSFAGCLVGFAAITGTNAPRHVPLLLAGSLAGVFGVAVIAWRCSRRPPKAALVCVIALLVIWGGLSFGYFEQLMRLGNYASARPFCERILLEIDEDDAVFFYDSYRPNMHFYMRRRMPAFKGSNEKVADALRGRSRIFLVIEERDIDTLDAGTAPYHYEMEKIDRAKVGSRDFVFVLVRSSKTAQ